MDSDALSAMSHIHFINLLNLDWGGMTFMEHYAFDDVRSLLIIMWRLLERVSIHSSCSGVRSSLSSFVEFDGIFIMVASRLLLIQEVAHTTVVVDTMEIKMRGPLHKVAFWSIIVLGVQSTARTFMSLFPQILNSKNRRWLSLLIFLKFSVRRTLKMTNDGACP